jgi:hypothetical protein
LLAAELFYAMFGPLDDTLLGYIDAWIESASPDDMCLIGKILSKAEPAFVFDCESFVVRLAVRAQQHSDEVYDKVLSCLYQAATGGVKSANFGEPFREDLELNSKSAKVLEHLPRFSPAYKLYDTLKKEAQRNIKTAIQESED